MRVPTNRDIYSFIVRYGVFAGLIVLVCITIVPKIYHSLNIEDQTSMNCSLDELSTGTIVDYQGKKLIVTESTYLSGIGAAWIHLNKINQ